MKTIETLERMERIIIGGKSILLDGHEGQALPDLSGGGELAEVFVDSHRVGTDLQEMLQSVGMLVSSGLQHGVPVEALAGMLSHSSPGSVSAVLADVISREDIKRLIK